MRCPRHPQVETELTCGRCGEAICPRCLVISDVGVRCRDCAGLRRVPTYQVPPLMVGRGYGAALLAGGGLGFIWGFLLPFPGLFLGLFLGLGLGWALAEAVGRAANRKRGPPLQGAAVLGILVAYGLRNALAGLDYLPQNDLGGYLVVGAAVFLSLGQLR